MRAVIYARYSSENQREASIEDQIEICRRLIDRQGWQLVETFADRSISGASAANRPAFQQMITSADSQSFDVIVTEAIDRLGRKLADVATLFDRLTYLGIKIHTVSTGEVSTLQIGMLGTMAQMYLSDLKEKTWRGQLGRVLQGKIPAGRAYGYDIIKDKSDQGGGRKINPIEAAIIRRIFKEYAAGKSPRDITAGLNDDGVPGPEGDTWRDTTIRGQVARGTGLLNNTLYIGKLIWNRVAYVKHPLTGKRQARVNSEDKWEISDVPHLRIIDDELWQKVKLRQKAVRIDMSSNKTNPLNGSRRRQYLLSGLLVCGECGSLYTVAAQNYYKCSQFRHKATCTNSKGIGRRNIEGRVLSGLKEKLMSPEMVEEFTKSFHDEINRSNREAEQHLRQDKKQLTDLGRKIGSIISAIEDGAYSAALKKRLEELEAKKAESERRLANPPPSPIRIHPKLSEVYRKKVGDLAESLGDDSIRLEAAEVLRSLIDRVVLTPTDNGLRAELYGDLAHILSLAEEKSQKAQRPGQRPGRELSVVAGTHNCLKLLLETQVLALA